VSTVLDQGNRTFIGSVVFLDVVGYTKKSVSEQIAMKDRFTSALSAALKDIAAEQRIILDTGDGAAITFLGDPEDALFVAMHVRDAVKTPVADATATDGEGADPQVQADLPLRIGINLGPVKLIRDINGQPNIIGDGINVAQRIMSFSPTGKIVVSRSYYDVVSVISDEYSTLFSYDGSRTDKHVRDHEIYLVGDSAAAFKQAKDGMFDRAANTDIRLKTLQLASAGPVPKAGRTAETGGKTGWLNDRRKLAYAGAALAVLVVALSTALVAKRAGDKPEVRTEIAGGTTAPATPESGVSSNPAANTPTGKPGQNVAPVAEVQPAATGSVTFSIRPWGEVFVNGKSIGVSPPLKQTKLLPGKYSIEIKNMALPPFTTVVDVKPNENAKIAHKF